MFEDLEKLEAATRKIFLDILEMDPGLFEVPNGEYIYMLYDGTQGKDCIVYIGQSEDLLSRLGSHLRDKVFTHFAYYLIPYNVDINVLEMALIKYFQPIYNKQHDGSRESEKNFPRQLTIIDQGLRSKYMPVRKELLQLSQDMGEISRKYEKLIENRRKTKTLKTDFLEGLHAAAEKL